MIYKVWHNTEVPQKGRIDLAEGLRFFISCRYFTDTFTVLLPRLMMFMPFFMLSKRRPCRS